MTTTLCWRLPMVPPLASISASSMTRPRSRSGKRCARTGGRPLLSYTEHTAEVHGLDWCLHEKDAFCSASWDGTVKVWSPEQANSVATFTEHSGAYVYEARWAPHRRAA